MRRRESLHPRRPRRHATLVGLVVTLIAAALPASASADWLIYGKDLSNSRNARTDGPTKAQVANMEEEWRFDSPTGDFTGTPVTSKGLVIAGDYSGMVYALDAVTGKVRWKRDVGEQVNASAGINPSAPGGGVVFVPVAKEGSPKLVALSLRDGRVRWSSVITDQPTSFVFGSPVHYAGKVFIGSSGPNGDGSTARGTVVAFDQLTGAVRWRTFTVPPGRDGGPVWSTPAIDPAAGRLYVGTGNAYHDPAASTTDAILALDVNSGVIEDHYQAIPDDVFGPDNPTGPDVDFGASPNLIRSPNGTPLVGEGAKDGNYYAVDRANLNLAWKRQNGPGSVIGGFIGSTAYNGTRVFGTNALTGQVAAINRDGSVGWTNGGEGPAAWSPLALANGVLYTLSSRGALNMRDAASGELLNTVDIGDTTFGGMSTTGRAVYLSVGVGPPPPPAPQEHGTGSIVALGDTSRSRGPLSRPGGRRGGPGAPATPRQLRRCRVRGGARLRLRVRPKHVRMRRRKRFRFRVTCKGRPVRRAVVRFKGRRKRTGRRGRATIVVRLKRRGRHVARVRRRGLRSGRAVVRAYPRRH